MGNLTELDQVEVTPLPSPAVAQNKKRDHHSKWILVLSVMIALCGPFHLGYNVSELNVHTFNDPDECNARPVAAKTCVIFPGHTELEWAIVVNAWFFSAAAGSLLSNYPADRLGRVWTFRINATIVIVGSILQGFAQNIPMLAVGRFVSGFASGCGLAVAGAYINEIAPTKLRGALGCSIQLTVVFSIMVLAFLMIGLHTADTWRYLLGMPVLIGIVQWALSFVCVESPHWLIATGDDDAARHELWRLFGDVEGDKICDELLAAQESDESRHASPVPTADGVEEEIPIPKYKPSVFDQDHRHQLIVAVGLCTLMHFVGINVVFMYSSSFLTDAGIEDTIFGFLI